MDLYDRIVELGKRRGIFFPSFEIYGGLSGFFDYGPIGSLLKRNLVDKWRKMFVLKEGMVEIESVIITPERVFEGSGHIAHFTDMTTKCFSCGRTYRTELLLRDCGVEVKEGMKGEELDRLVEEKGVKCPECSGKLSRSEPFNLMFKVAIGPYERGVTGYGRPEAAQAQFVDFKRVYLAERERLPLGIAQVGRCLRNEIAPRKGPIRLREFTIIDYEIFVDPEDTTYPRIKGVKDKRLRILTADEQLRETDRTLEVTVGEALKKGLIGNEVQAYFSALAVKYLEELGIPSDKQRLREQLPMERAHYSRQTFDQEVWLERWGWTEVSGHANRSDFDLSRHMIYSGFDMRVFKPFDKPKVVRRLTMEPRRKLIEEDFDEDASRILDLLSRSDPALVKKWLDEKGFYELPGPRPVRLEARHVKFGEVEEVANGRYFIPHVIEPSFGVDRIFYSVLEYAYSEKNGRVVLRLPRDVAPIKVSVFPLMKKNGLQDVAEKIYGLMIDEGVVANYDDTGSIGRRYARADEIGVPVCVTVDYETLEDDTVTLRDRDSWRQVRVGIDGLPGLLRRFFMGLVQFDDLGAPFGGSG